MPRAVLTSRKATPDRQTRAGLRWLCQTDVFALARTILHGDRSPADNHITEGFHRPLCDYMQTTRHAKNLYLLPRGYLKTTLITCARNVQRILANPAVRILIASNKADNAEAMLAELKGYLAHPWLVWLFPDILYADPQREAEKWTGSQIIVKRKRRTKEATVETIGVTGELTSKHYDHGTFDDVVGKENSQTRELLLDTITFIRVAEPLFDPGATQDYVGTPWHYADAWAWLQEQREALDLGVYIDPCWVKAEPGSPGAVHAPGFGTVRARFPERFPVTELLRIRKAEGSAHFAAQYLLNPVSADTVYFPRDKVLKHVVPRQELPPLGDCWVIMTVDPAISTSRWADYSAVAVVGFAPDGRMLLLDLRRDKWNEAELIAQIYDAYLRIQHRGAQVQTIGFEAIGFAKIYRRLMHIEGQKRGWFLPVTALERDTNKTKNARIRGLQPIWDAEELWIDASVPALEDFLDEAERWRPDRENAHDDMLDAVVDALQVRAQPPERPKPTWTDDPVLQEQIDFEDTAQAQRAAAGAGALDRLDLREAFAMHRRRQAMDAEVAAMAGESAMGEWA